jgi:hypothetical protein
MLDSQRGKSREILNCFCDEFHRSPGEAEGAFRLVCDNKGGVRGAEETDSWGTAMRSHLLPLVIVLLLMLSMGVLPLAPTTTHAQSEPQAATVSNAIVNNYQTSLTLPSGAQEYVYGYVTGGAYSSSGFAYGQYASVTNAAGNVPAALALTTSNTNSFSTSASYFAIGGVSVSGFSSVSSSYGSNGTPSASSASVTFIVSVPGSLVVIVGEAGDGQSMSISGSIPGLSVDATNFVPPCNQGLPPVMEIASAYPSVGTYTVTEQTSQCAAGQNPNNAGDLIGVFVFTPGSTTSTTTTSSVVGVGGSSSLSTSQAAISSSSSEPVWAFKGAYATYQISLSYQGGSIGGISVPSGSITSTVNYTIAGLNTQSQTFEFSATYSGYFAALSSSNLQASFLNPLPFPVVSSADLSALNSGKTPADLSTVSVATGVSVEVPAGTFNTDEVSLSTGGTIWVDSSSGLIVQATGSFLGYPPGSNGATIELESTNIPTSGSGSTLWLYAAVIVAVIIVAAAGGFFVLRRRRSRTMAVGAPPAVINTQSEQKLARLKNMLDAGLITQEEYDEQRKKFTS